MSLYYCHRILCLNFHSVIACKFEARKTENKSINHNGQQQEIPFGFPSVVLASAAAAAATAAGPTNETPPWLLLHLN